jgi:hypothetical protein
MLFSYILAGNTTDVFLGHDQSYRQRQIKIKVLKALMEELLSVFFYCV